jgi:putative YhgA-like transposase
MPIDVENESFRLLFTHPRMVRDLFLGFVREPWVPRLDFATLEPSPGGGEGADPVWRLRFQGGRTWIHLLLALAPEVDRALPLRLAGRLAELLLGLAEQGGPSGQGRPGGLSGQGRPGDLSGQGLPDGLPRSRRLPALPAVVPLILYYGEPPWSVPRQLADLFAPVPHGLERALPRLSPLVLDVRREPIPENLPAGNLAALLFTLERSRTLADLDRGVTLLTGLLPGPMTGPLADLRRAFIRYLRDGLLPRRFAVGGEDEVFV